MFKPIQKTLLVLLLTYAVASLIHNIHNAEFLADYPGLPVSWSRAGVYLTWITFAIVGLAGWILLVRRVPRVGLLLLAVYAMPGLVSLGHYVFAPMSDHSVTMNATILFEVATAALVLIEVVRQMARHTLRNRYVQNGS